MSSEPASSARERVECYAGVPHEAHDWTFADDYPLMHCPGLRAADFDEDGSWLPL